jgi:hypothetical protein
MLLLRGADTTVDASAMSQEENQQYLEARKVLEQVAHQLFNLACAMNGST